MIYSKKLSSYFYVRRLDDQLLVISIGSDSPFEFVDILIKTIQKEAERIDKNGVEIYFDLLSCVGNNENRYSKLIYFKKQPNELIDKVVAVKSCELPDNVSQELKKFYAKHLSETLLYSILSNKEKSKLTASSVV
ncbi:MAG: type II toxin-antitoxin system RnlB family antitoxin [Nitrospirota bacterium]